MLIVCRILQGLGGGGMPTSEQAILADTFPPQKRGQAFALYGIAVIVAPTVGPTIGGWITDNFSWHWIFFINVPIGLASLALVHWLVDEPEVLERERAERLAGGLKVDWVGFFLIALDARPVSKSSSTAGKSTIGSDPATIVTFSDGRGRRVFRLHSVGTQSGRTDRRNAAVVSPPIRHGLLRHADDRRDPVRLEPDHAAAAADQLPYTAMLSGLAMMPGGIAMLVIMPIAGAVTGRFQPKYLMVLGLAGIALSMWYSTSLTPDASFDYFGWVRVYQTIGLPFLFIPINTVAYDGLPANKTNQASALMNVARNLGGSVGISLANVVLTQRAQFHQSRLAENITPTSPVFQSTLRQTTNYFLQHGAPAGQAHNLAIGFFGQLIQTQATILAYIDVFHVCAITAAVMIPLVLIMVRRVQIQAQAVVGH